MNPLLENRFKKIENEIKEWYLSIKPLSQKFMDEMSNMMRSNLLVNQLFANRNLASIGQEMGWGGDFNVHESGHKIGHGHESGHRPHTSIVSPTSHTSNSSHASHISDTSNVSQKSHSSASSKISQSLVHGDSEHTSPTSKASSSISNWVTVQDLLNTLEYEHGIRLQDCPELKFLLSSQLSIKESIPFSKIPLPFEIFFQIVGTEDSDNIVKRAFTGRLAIPNWREFCTQMKEIYEIVKKNDGGHNATYIPQLAEVDPNLFGVSLVTVDGQRLSLGDTTHEFTIQSCSKIFTYCIACEDIGSEQLHKHIGYEPSGKSFNAFTLDRSQKPHNPLINSGAITTCSLIRCTASATARFNFIQKRFSEFAGGAHIAFDNATFLSERDTADRNFALAHYMKENFVFPSESKLSETLDLYFQSCSILVNSEKLAVMASTLANGGTCPTTDQRVVSPQIVKNILQLSYSCGMYDFSGEWSVSVGLPAKSGVSGAIAVVVPGVMGLSVFSPPLDKRGNTVRGVDFCIRANKKFRWAIFDRLVKTGPDEDPNEDMGEHDVDHLAVPDEENTSKFHKELPILHMDSIQNICSQHGYGGADAGQNTMNDVSEDGEYHTQSDLVPKQNHSDVKNQNQVVNPEQTKSMNIAGPISDNDSRLADFPSTRREKPYLTIQKKQFHEEPDGSSAQRMDHYRIERLGQNSSFSNDNLTENERRSSSVQRYISHHYHRSKQSMNPSQISRDSFPEGNDIPHSSQEVYHHNSFDSYNEYNSSMRIQRSDIKHVNRESQSPSILRAVSPIHSGDSNVVMKRIVMDHEDSFEFQYQRDIVHFHRNPTPINEKTLFQSYPDQTSVPDEIKRNMPHQSSRSEFEQVRERQSSNYAADSPSSQSTQGAYSSNGPPTKRARHV